PMLLLHGVQDRVLPCAHSEKAAAQAAGVRFQGVDDCGHTPQLEQPDVFNQALRSLVLQG
ncbi:MAG TPA: alpha/beta hydrolase, partial [Burkholderiaceae bacterium]|nr:alpha/beta hydrolase [Burkholderiaceae bacterium]